MVVMVENQEHLEKAGSLARQVVAYTLLSDLINVP
jgi:hypothetical protein